MSSISLENVLNASGLIRMAAVATESLLEAGTAGQENNGDFRSTDSAIEQTVKVAGAEDELDFEEEPEDGEERNCTAPDVVDNCEKPAKDEGEVAYVSILRMFSIFIDIVCEQRFGRRPSGKRGRPGGRGSQRR